MQAHSACKTISFGAIYVRTNTVFRPQFVAIPSSGSHNTVALVLHDQICRMLCNIKSLVVLLLSLHASYIYSQAIHELI